MLRKKINSLCLLGHNKFRKKMDQKHKDVDEMSASDMLEDVIELGFDILMSIPLTMMRFSLMCGEAIEFLFDLLDRIRIKKE